MKRSNRLVLLIGVLLAVVTFGGVLFYLQGSANQGPGTVEDPAFKTVFAAVDVTIGTPIEESMLKLEDRTASQRAAGAYNDPGLVIGKIARKNIKSGQQITPDLFATTAGPITQLDVPPTMRAIAVQVDQVSGVGTLIRAGDYVDLLLALTSAQFPVITVADDGTITTVPGLNGTSSKLILQGMQVLGTLLPPPPAQGEGQPPSDGTTLTGQQAIVLLAVTPQQAEVIKFAQLDGSISLVLRSPADFLDENGQPRTDVVPDETTGIILKSLVDEYGLLVPQLVQTILPEGPITPN